MIYLKKVTQLNVNEPKDHSDAVEYADREWTRNIADAREAAAYKKLMQDIQYELSLPALPQSSRMPHPSTLRRHS